MQLFDGNIWRSHIVYLRVFIYFIQREYNFYSLFNIHFIAHILINLPNHTECVFKVRWMIPRINIIGKVPLRRIIAIIEKWTQNWNKCEENNAIEIEIEIKVQIKVNITERRLAMEMYKIASFSMGFVTKDCTWTMTFRWNQQLLHWFLRWKMTLIQSTNIQHSIRMTFSSVYQLSYFVQCTFHTDRLTVNTMTFDSSILLKQYIG